MKKKEKEKLEFPATLSYKANGDQESKIVNQKFVKLALDVYMSPQQFADLISEKEGKAFIISID